MNISYQEILIFAVLALVVFAAVWLVVRVIKAFVSGYRSASPDAGDHLGGLLGEGPHPH